MPEIETLAHPPRQLPSRVVDLLGEFWTDYRHQRRMAVIEGLEANRSRTHRPLRMGLVLFLAYVNGVVNRWRGHLAVAPLDDTNRSLTEKFADLAEFLGTSPVTSAVPSALERLESLANRCGNLRPDDEAALLRDLNVPDLEREERRVIDALNELAGGLNSCFPGGAMALEAVVSAEILAELDATDRAYEATKDDPLAFQDPPGTWEEIEMESQPTPEAD